MTKTFEIAVFQGDGIGPEIMVPTLEILERMAAVSDDYKLKHHVPIRRWVEVSFSKEWAFKVVCAQWQTIVV